MKRDRLEIIYAILYAFREAPFDEVTGDRIRVWAKLSDTQCYRYLQFLAKIEAIYSESVASRLTWRLTAKGRELRDKLTSFLREFGYLS